MRKFCFIGLLLLSVPALSQVGGNGIYTFLNLPAAPRMAAMGGSPVAIADSDPNVGFYLPSLLSPAMHNHLAMNYMNYFSDINVGMVTYARQYGETGVFSAGMLYSNYGKFQQTDAGGNVQGEFRAADYSFQLGYGNQYGKLGYGANLKFVYSQLEQYKSFGNALDFSLSYTGDSGLFATAILFRNLGIQWSDYAGQRESLPFELQWSFSRKLKHAPLRLFAVLHHLNTWNIAYLSPEEKKQNLSFDQNEQKTEPGFGDNLFRHVILGTELVFSPNFMIRFAYNHQRRREMTWQEGKGFTGFSWGVGMKIRRFRLDYSLASYFPGKSSHQFAVTLNLDEFKKQ